MDSNPYEKLKQVRLMKKMTLKDLARESGLSYSYISQVERGGARPSLLSLKRLAKALDVSVWRLFKDEDEPEIQAIKAKYRDPLTQNNYQSSDQTDHDGQERKNIRQTKMVKKNMRRSIILPQSNIRYEMITPDLTCKMQILTMEAEPGTDSGDYRFEHVGEECCFLQSGRLEIEVGTEKYILEAGDSLYFSSEIPHRWVNIGEEKISILWITTPPTY